VNNNLLEKSGAWFSYKGERIGQGRENARQFLKDNKDVYTKLEADVRKQLGLAPLAQSAASSTSTGRVTTMPTAAPEPAKAAARR